MWNMQQFRILMEFSGSSIPAFILYTLVIAEIRRTSFTCPLVQEYDFAISFVFAFTTNIPLDDSQVGHEPERI